MSKIVSEFEYNSLVTPELITQISDELHLKLTHTFLNTNINIPNLLNIELFVKAYLNQLEREEVIPSCFGSYSIHFDINKATLSLNYHPPYFTKQPTYTIGYVFYTIDVYCSDDLITKHTIKNLKQIDSCIRYEVVMNYSKEKERTEYIYEHNILYRDKYSTFSAAKKALDSKIDNWLTNYIEDIEDEVQEKKRILKDMKEF